MKSWKCLLVVLALAWSGGAWSAEEDPAHAELRAIRDKVIAAFQAGQVEGILEFVHPNAVVTWQNGETVRGREGVRQYFKKMMDGPGKIVEKYEINPEVSELTILYGGDTGIAFGTSNDHIKLTSGLDTTLKGFWSTTVIKEDGKWLIAAYHASLNGFDNPIMQRKAQMGGAIGGGIGVLVGLLLGLLAMRLRKKQAA